MNVVLDPGWSRRKQALVGRDISFAWLAANRLPLPDRVFFDRDAANTARRAAHSKSKHLLKPEWYGVYQRAWPGGWSAVAVDVAGCPTQRRVNVGSVPPFWQSPGSPQDFTPIGVICHEVGHHVDYTLHPKAYSTVNGFEAVVDGEEDISSVEHNILESFAEAIRLFITNPALLREGRPDRFDYLTRSVGLKPLHGSPWRTVLGKAGKRVLASVERWIAL